MSFNTATHIEGRVQAKNDVPIHVHVHYHHYGSNFYMCLKTKSSQYSGACGVYIRPHSARAVCFLVREYDSITSISCPLTQHNAWVNSRSPIQLHCLMSCHCLNYTVNITTIKRYVISSALPAVRAASSSNELL